MRRKVNPDRGVAENPREAPEILVSLPLAFRDGMDIYNGMMRYLRENRICWSMRIVRNGLHIGMLRGYRIERLAGAICGPNINQGIDGYEAGFDRDVAALFSSKRIPAVYVGNDFHEIRLTGRSLAANITIDSAQVGIEAAKFLSSARAYASFGYVDFSRAQKWSRERGTAFVGELRRRGQRRVWVFRRSDAKEMEFCDWLKSLPKPAAVFAANDSCADAVIRACAAAELGVPQDMSVLGVDDDPVFCVHTMPTLSSIHPDFELVGYEAAKTLAGFLAGERPCGRREVSGNVTLTERVSTAAFSQTSLLVRRADGMIAELSGHNLTSEFIASALGVSRSLLDLRYRQVKGHSIGHAMEAAKMNIAKRLLLNTNMSHREISRNCGYKSEFYLEHVFQKRVGCSMKDFRCGHTEASI